MLIKPVHWIQWRVFTSLFPLFLLVVKDSGKEIITPLRALHSEQGIWNRDRDGDIEEDSWTP